MTQQIQVYEGQIVPEALTQREYESLRDSMGNMRDLLICKLLRGTGLRINELMRCCVYQVSVNGPEVGLLVAREKKRSPKPVYGFVPLPPSLGVELRAFITGQGLKPEQRIFGITDRQVRRIFATAGLKAIGRRVHPHELRGLYATFLIDNGLPIEAAAHLLGHSDYRTTQKHYYKLNAEKIAAIQRRIPV
jgi:site-specific recombinase XerD